MVRVRVRVRVWVWVWVRVRLRLRVRVAPKTGRRAAAPRPRRPCPYAYVGNTACMVPRPVWPASQSISANWPRLAEAGGCPELDLALAGRIKAGVGSGPLGHLGFHMSVRPAELTTAALRPASSGVTW